MLRQEQISGNSNRIRKGAVTTMIQITECTRQANHPQVIAHHMESGSTSLHTWKTGKQHHMAEVVWNNPWVLAISLLAALKINSVLPGTRTHT